jgi:ABC-type transport system involved in multi-copper enzyme maturation permease subunit
MNPGHVWLVVTQEFRMRLRTGRWRLLLGSWVAMLALFTFLVDDAMQAGRRYDVNAGLGGVPLFGALMFFVLASMLVISPALTAQSVNGDRERGTLAALQVTRLRPAEIAVGKLVAGWSVGLVALLLSTPFAGYATARGGLPLGRIPVVYAVVALLIGSVCAVSQALSALMTRTITSALLSYVVTAALTIGSVVVFLVALAFTTDRRGVQHSDEVWWLLAPNPFVILADSAPRVPSRLDQTGHIVSPDDLDPLSSISKNLRELRVPAEYFYSDQPGPPPDRPLWPYGLGFLVVLGAGSLVITTVRLRTPTDRLPPGVRVA